MDDVAFLSVRVPSETKRFIKQIAARKGASVQDVIGGLVDDFIERESRARPSLAEAVSRLRGAKAGLRKHGVAHIDLFGSIVRNEADSESDIDVVVEFKQRRGMSLSKFASLRTKLEDILGYEVDLAENKSLRPEVKRAFQRDALRVF
jgi:predicted nucleotidyltransferase